MSKLLTALSLFVLLASCAPKVQTQPDRLDYMHKHVDRNIKLAMKCDDYALTFVNTEEHDGYWYDYYVVEGCGQKSDYLTRVRQVGKMTESYFWIVPKPREFSEAATDHLNDAAGAELDCPDVQLEVVEEEVSPLRDAYSARIAARGCDTEANYLAACKHSKYEAGEHHIVCDHKPAS